MNDKNRSRSKLAPGLTIKAMRSKHPTLLSIFTAAIILFAFSAHADNEPSNTKAIDGVDPTMFIIRLEFKNIYDHGPNDAHINTTLVRGDYVIKRRFLIRVDAPLVYADLPGNDNEYGFGDLTLRLGGLITRHKYFAVAAGVDFIFDTSTAEVLGSGKYTAGPLFVTTFYPADWLTIATPFIKYYRSYAGDDSRPDINYLEIETDFQFTLPKKWWVQLQPKVLVDFDDNDRGTFLLEAEAGKMVTEHIGLWIHPGVTLAGKKPYDFSVEAGFRYLFKY